jgi:antitoxin component HigA of HigAB toxin-antitoxin module
MISPEFQAFYDTVLALVGELMKSDPDPATPEGQLLEALASAAETYEKAKYPL